MPKKISHPPIDRNAQLASHSSDITISGLSQFYRIVNWLNKNVGQGSKYWTMNGRPMRQIKRNGVVTVTIYVFDQSFDPSNFILLNLI